MGLIQILKTEEYDLFSNFIAIKKQHKKKNSQNNVDICV